MTVNQITNLVTALTGLFIAIGGVIAAIKVLHEVRAGNVKTDEVHAQLNSNLQASNAYQESLRTALQEAGITIPTDPSLQPGEPTKEVPSAVRDPAKGSGL